MKQIRIIVIRFDNKIEADETDIFRSSVLKSFDNNCDVLFHNHLTETTYRYSYSMIQYKRINRCAAIVCIEQGVDLISTLLVKDNLFLYREGMNEKMEINSMNASKYTVQVWNTPFVYHIRKWLALNEKNYEIFRQKESLKDKCEMLERILVSNILSFCSGIDFKVEKTIECSILELSEPKQRKYKGVYLTSFDCKFKTNISLPDFIGLGKGTSIGFGMIKRTYNNKNKEQNEER